MTHYPDNRDFQTTAGQYKPAPPEALMRAPPTKKEAPERVPYDPQVLSTTQRQAFTPKEGTYAPVHAKRPELPHLPFAGNTTQKDHFPGHQPQPGQKASPRREAPPSVPFAGETTNHAHFPAHEVSIPDKVRPAVPEKVPVKGDFKTTNGELQNDLLNAMGNARPEDIRPVKGGPPPRDLSKLPFEGDTSYHAHYPPKESPRDGRPKKGPEMTHYPDNRDFQTTAGGAFKPIPHGRIPVPCPATYLKRTTIDANGHHHVIVANLMKEVSW
jgi:hypothetical protein